jgi:hypothetical protein
MDATLRVRGNSGLRAALGAALVSPVAAWLGWQFGVLGWFIAVALAVLAATAWAAMTPYACGRCGKPVSARASRCEACGSPFTDAPAQRAHRLGAGHALDGEDGGSLGDLTFDHHDPHDHGG